ncbi:MAG TPA: hypothetical protein VM820_21860, partial [Vicinamibacterales bacterium]|nr:hypothetical protein [Vicinamibacterales bacterium]
MPDPGCRIRMQDAGDTDQQMDLQIDQQVDRQTDRLIARSADRQIDRELSTSGNHEIPISSR